MSSHSSGIQVTEQIRSKFAAAEFRALFLQISPKDEHFNLVHVLEKSAGNWQDDYLEISKTIKGKDDPYFVIYQCEPKSFLLISYIPDDAQVRLKMLYSSSKHTLMKQLGDSLFADHFYANCLADLKLEAYQAHQISKSDSSQPLTNREIELSKIKLAENGSNISVSSKHSFNNGISLKFTNDQLLRDFNNSSKSHLVFTISQDEKFTVENFGDDFGSFVSHLTSTSPRFSLFNYNGGGNGKSGSKVVFLYTCPVSSAVRERMLYSASRAGLLSSISEFIPVDVKCELSDMSELSETWMTESCGFNSIPESEEKKSGFIKKTISGPGSGPRRLIRSQQP